MVRANLREISQAIGRHVDDRAPPLCGKPARSVGTNGAALEAHSAAEALVLLESGRQIDLLITDQLMPKMTGAELIQIVRERWPDLRFILATGYAEQPVGLSPISNLPRLAKPFGLQELSRLIYLCVGAVPLQGINDAP